MAVPYNPPDDLQISYYLLKHCDLWVWDFDDTLIDTTTYYVQDMSPSAIRGRTEDELIREIPCWKYFRDLVIFLVATGKKVGIASFGTYEIIQAYMDRIFGRSQKYFNKSNIKASCLVDRRSKEFKMPHNKNAYIYELMQFYRVQDYEKVVLFDDLASNIADASALGVLGIIIPGRDQNGVNNTRQLFCPDIMYHIDNEADNRCDKNIYLRREFGSIGLSKASAREKQFSRMIRYRHPNRIYKTSEMVDREKREAEALRKLNEERNEETPELIAAEQVNTEEGFKNIESEEEDYNDNETIWQSLKKIFSDEGKSDCGCTNNAWIIYVILIFILLILVINYLL